jgi:hypothetical protein
MQTDANGDGQVSPVRWASNPLGAEWLGAAVARLCTEPPLSGYAQKCSRRTTCLPMPARSETLEKVGAKLPLDCAKSAKSAREQGW